MQHHFVKTASIKSIHNSAQNEITYLVILWKGTATKNSNSPQTLPILFFTYINPQTPLNILGSTAMLILVLVLHLVRIAKRCFMHWCRLQHYSQLADIQTLAMLSCAFATTTTKPIQPVTSSKPASQPPVQHATVSCDRLKSWNISENDYIWQLGL